MPQVHILNGDSLKAQWPLSLSEDLIVARECLIDGNVQGNNLTEFFANRAKFIATYDGCSETGYYQATVPEFEKVLHLQTDSIVYCWFEDDLFCQTNFWFVLWLLSKKANIKTLYLIRPNAGNEYSFAHMSQTELIEAFENRILIEADELNTLASLWPYYQQQQSSCIAKRGDINHAMYNIARQLNVKFPFLLPVIQAQIARMPNEQGIGKPEQSLLAIIDELNTHEFAPIFRVFNQREAIYSFGDLQVKQMLERLVKNES